MAIAWTPSTLFEGPTLDKHFAPWRMQDAPWDNNPVQMLQPGVRLEIADYNNPEYAGIVAAGWGLVGNYVIDIEYSNAEQTIGGSSSQVGIAVVMPMDALPKASTELSQKSEFCVVVVGIGFNTAGAPPHRYMMHIINPYGGGSSPKINDSIFQTSEGIASGKLRIARTGDAEISGYYWWEDEWVLIGTFDSGAALGAGTDIEGNSADIDMLLDNPIHMPAAVTLSQNGAGHTTFDVDSFTLVSGELVPKNITTVDESFDDATTPGLQLWQRLWWPESGNDSVPVESASGASLDIDWTDQPSEPGGQLGYVSTFCAFPGTDIDVTMDCFVRTEDGGSFCELRFSDRLIDNEDLTYICARLGSRGAGADDIQAFMMRNPHAGEINVGGYDLVESDGTTGHRGTLRLTRVGNVWSMYHSGEASPFASYTDTAGIYTDRPLQVSFRAKRTNEESDYAFYSLGFAAGDYIVATPFLLVPDINDGDGWLISKHGDYTFTNTGDLSRDDTIATRCRIRLMTRRGEWFADKTLGSRLHEIETTKNAERKIIDTVTEALQPMLDDGSILAISAGTTSVDHQNGRIFSEVFVTTPDKKTISVGVIPLGE